MRLTYDKKIETEYINRKNNILVFGNDPKEKTNRSIMPMVQQALDKNLNMIVFETSGVLSGHFSNIYKDNIYVNSENNVYVNLFKEDEAKVIRIISNIIIEISKEFNYKHNIDKQLIENAIKAAMRVKCREVTILDILDIVNMTDEGRVILDTLRMKSVDMLLNIENKNILLDNIELLEWFKLYNISYNVDKTYIENRELLTNILSSKDVKNIFMPKENAIVLDFEEIFSKGKSIFVCNSGEDPENIFISKILIALTEQYLLKNRNKNDIYVYIDDFSLFKSLDYLYIMQNSKYLNVYSTVSVENIVQIMEYSKFWGSHFMDSIDIKIIYPQMQEDDKSYFSNKLDYFDKLYDGSNVLYDLGVSKIYTYKCK